MRFLRTNSANATERQNSTAHKDVRLSRHRPHTPLSPSSRLSRSWREWRKHRTGRSESASGKAKTDHTVRHLGLVDKTRPPTRPAGGRRSPSDPFLQPSRQGPPAAAPAAYEIRQRPAIGRAGHPPLTSRRRGSTERQTRRRPCPRPPPALDPIGGPALQPRALASHAPVAQRRRARVRGLATPAESS
jgi:hypothetical protein